ncbi:MAG: DNA internalization-related competence protein ComEC/Rec2 [Methylobacter sp.]|uniref:DNA internalization-related competence protein ComEC/Rec2 n=1 Tax=Methylobacter sp. TaxID=2051955 RepID=UPI0027305013|nr:DNA internalization-related competence protein ComEC/Rec2 [Methylobacter sp.]MDP1665181.1 DNA internalization-related competence protein ComEC/Rec2 [Methylobacter sp.]MDP1970778.1 DNA internalization-related competence protein ComEC/Rec2 [Methylobacter sp.]
MVVSALSFLAGLLLVQQLTVLPDIKCLIVGGIAACIIAWLRYWRCLFFVAGVLWAVVFAMHRLSDRLPEQLEGTEIQVTGTIADLPEQDEKRARFDFITRDGVYAANLPGAGAAAISPASDRQLPAKLRLSWYYPDQSIKAGQQWVFTVKLKRVHGNMNPGGFDYERWLFTEGVGATGYVRPSPKPVLLGRDSVWSSISVWRQSITDQLSSTLGSSSSLALIKALTIGDGNSVTQQQWEVFRKTGTTHLVVISGSHIGLIAGLVYFLVLKLWARTGLLAWSPQKVAAVAAVLVAVFYSGLAGFSVPTQRSVVMLSIVMAAIILQRNSRPFNTLSIAMFAVLIVDPLAVLSAGFWLSFLAVAVIVYAVSGRLGQLGPIWGAIKINWATSVGLSPLLLLFFQQVSLIAPLANLIAVPVISLLVVPLSLLAVLIMFISPTLASELFYLIDYVLQGLWWLLDHLAEIPMASVNHALPSYWALLFAVPGILLLLAPVGIPARWLSLVMFLPLVFTDTKQPETGDINMTLLDVGQGLSAVVQTTHHLLVYDTGAKFSEQSDMGKSVLLPFLHSQGIAKVDTLVISHGDNDHIGGAVSLMRGIDTKQVLTSVPQLLSEYAPIACKAGQSWLWDEVKFTVLSPQQAFVSENDNSCVLKIQSKHGTVLLTGDIEAAAESWLVETYDEALKADVLVAPHHGSKTSSTVGFLQVIQPDYVLIPAGYRNQFGHPHRDVLARYRQANAKWLNSADSGAIVANVKSNVLVVQGMRETESKYWNIK